MVTETEEDYTKLMNSGEYEIICTTTNMIVKPDGRLVMGGGVAKLMLDRYPDIDIYFGEIIKSVKRQMIQVVDGLQHDVWQESAYLVGFPTKIDYRDPSPLWLVERSMKQLVAFRAMVGGDKVLLPCPGAGLGGLDKDVVMKLINSIDGVDENIHVCYRK